MRSGFRNGLSPTRCVAVFTTRLSLCGEMPCSFHYRRTVFTVHFTLTLGQNKRGPNWWAFTQQWAGGLSPSSKRPHPVANSLHCCSLYCELVGFHPAAKVSSMKMRNLSCIVEEQTGASSNRCRLVGFHPAVGLVGFHPAAKDHTRMLTV